MKEFIKQSIALIVFIVAFTIIYKACGLGGLIICGFSLIGLWIIQVEIKIDKLIDKNKTPKDLNDYIDNLKIE